MPIDPFAAIAIISVGAFLAAVGAWWLGRKTGLTEVQQAVREEQTILASTLRGRVEHLESENKRLREDISYLKRENTALQREVLQLQRDLIKLGLRHQEEPE